MVALEVIFLAVFWTWVACAFLFLRNTVLPRLPISDTPARFNLPFDMVQFQATDGLRLEGWKIPADPASSWIILCHGVGSNRADLLDIAAGLHKAGLNLFLFDFRGHGGSAGATTSFGWQEQRDLEGALVFLGQQPDVAERPYGVYGISMGGSAALMVAARDERIGAIVVDSPYTNLEESLGRHLSLLYSLPRVPFLWFVLSTYRLRFGIWPRRASPEECVSRLGRRPLLLIQGARDSRTPAQGAKAMVAKATGPKDLWVIEGAGHLEGFAANPPMYLTRLRKFFRTNLISS